MKRGTTLRKTRLRYKSARQRLIEDMDGLVREIVFARYGKACLRCMNETRPGRPIQAAHIYGKGAHPALRFEVHPYSNVIPLCKGCHFSWWHAEEYRRHDPIRVSECLRWCLETLGADHMAHLARLAIVRKGQRQDLKGILLYLMSMLRHEPATGLVRQGIV